ncbi:MAG: DUF1294 domain-containing protein [Bacteroidaceae bacterium]|nr:DUF1294 domain-containing protein [Bacteroidaceae bacterium]
MSILFFFIIALNAVTFLVYGIDKLKARKNKWRIPESTLLLLAAFGGSIGAWLGMRVWHHKTMHRKFKYGVPLILFLQIALLVYLFI